jgi:hypothetical protein
MRKPIIFAVLITFLSFWSSFAMADFLDISEFEITSTNEASVYLKNALTKTGGYVGGSAGTIEVVEDSSLPIEVMKVTIADDKVSIAGNPAKWAVYEFLGRKLGVRFLWPGELGTYIPSMKRVKLDRSNFEFRPELLRRDFRHGKAQQTVQDWCDKHYLAKQRMPKYLKWGHAQGDWYEKYFKKQPDLFAMNPQGKVAVWTKHQPERVKLRLSNPKVRELIVKEWLDEGKPNGICLSPTDSAGYDTSPETMAMDPVKYAKEDVWPGKVDLTDRHVKFWNEIHHEASKHNPNLKVCIYAYGAYREPPKTVQLTPNTYHVQLVPAWYESDKVRWQEWGKQADAMYLRPNWPFTGYSAPYLQLKKIGDFISFAYRNKMKGFDVDSITPFFGMRGPFYYLIARMMAHPELDPNQVLEEFYSGFGAARDEVREHYAYWEKYSDEMGMPVTAGGAHGGDPNGKYIRILEREKIPHNPLAGSMLMLPYLYTDEVIEPALAILRRGLAKAEGDEKKRVQFLIDAYEPFKAHRELASVYVNFMYKTKDESLLKVLAQKNREFVEIHNRVYAGVATVKDGLNKWTKSGLQQRNLDWKSLQGL